MLRTRQADLGRLAMLSPEDVNADPYNKGWMIELEANDKAEIDELMDQAAYTTHVAAQ